MEEEMDSKQSPQPFEAMSEAQQTIHLLQSIEKKVESSRRWVTAIGIIIIGILLVALLMPVFIALSAMML